ncbi:MAG TPA: hypothetical protein VHM30_02095 [Gemmatimonadaceae bacterium]|nr:hypothetical protein [Gemmatimonadaceae bacterium]
MTARPFVAELRTREGAIRVGSGAPTMTLRVEIPEVWDVVVIETSGSTVVSDVKRAAVTALLGPTADPDNLVLKLRGFEVLNESATVEDTGATDGSIFLATYRRRRPVR